MDKEEINSKIQLFQKKAEKLQAEKLGEKANQRHNNIILWIFLIVYCSPIVAVIIALLVSFFDWLWHCLF